MLYLKPANFEDIEKEHRFVAAEPADENGFTNDFSGISFENFKTVALPWSDEGQGFAHFWRGEGAA